MINLKKEIEPKHIPVLVFVLVVAFGVVVWIMSGVNKATDNAEVSLSETIALAPTQVSSLPYSASSSIATTTEKEKVESASSQKAASIAFDLNVVPDRVSKEQAVELIKGCYVKSIGIGRGVGAPIPATLKLSNKRIVHSQEKADKSMFDLLSQTGIEASSTCGFLVTPRYFMIETLGNPMFLYAADFSKDDILMGASHNVFIGRVIKETGNKTRGTSPETQFKVEIISNIKGELKGTVTVNQFGGYKNGTFVTVEDDTPMPNGKSAGTYMLEPGATYLLATRYNEQEDWYTLNSFPTARKLLSKDANANIADLKTLAQNDERVKALTAAYPNEKLLDADIQHGNVRNSYQALQKKP
jgi:hypothetical protein